MQDPIHVVKWLRPRDPASLMHSPSGVASALSLSDEDTSIVWLSPYGNILLD